MTDYADLEMGLHRRDEATYAIELRLSLPESDAEVRPPRNAPVPIAFDFAELRRLALNVPAYGRRFESIAQWQ